MEEEFEIPVVYRNQQLNFKAKHLILGSYTQKIQVIVNDVEVLFEVDEDRSYRAYIDPTNKEAIDNADKQLLEAIIKVLESAR